MSKAAFCFRIADQRGNIDYHVAKGAGDARRIGNEDERMNIGIQMSRDCRSVEGNIVCISIRVSVEGHKNL